jgi:hypothetical protein
MWLVLAILSFAEGSCGWFWLFVAGVGECGTRNLATANQDYKRFNPKGAPPVLPQFFIANCWGRSHVIGLLLRCTKHLSFHMQWVLRNQAIHPVFNKPATLALNGEAESGGNPCHWFGV